MNYYRTEEPKPPIGIPQTQSKKTDITEHQLAQTELQNAQYLLDKEKAFIQGELINLTMSYERANGLLNIINERADLITTTMVSDRELNQNDVNRRKNAQEKYKNAIALQAASITSKYNKGVQKRKENMLTESDTKRYLNNLVRRMLDVHQIKKQPKPTHVTDGSYLTPERLALNPKQVEALPNLTF